MEVGMGKINMSKVLVGGLLAGLVLNIFEFIVHQLILGNQWAEAMEKLGMSGPAGVTIAWFVILTFVLGIALVWIYAAIRPRFGAGAKTAVCAGLFVWFLIWFWASIGFVIMGLFPLKLFIIPAIIGLIEVPLATVVGAWLYKEE